MISHTTSGLLFGATSLTGYALAMRFAHQLIPVANPGRAHRSWPRLAVEDHRAVAHFVEKVRPELVIYAHAVCDVAKCEANPEWAHEINERSVENVLRVISPKTRFVYLSSDHVFGGDGSYDEESPTSPISVYGQTRVAAERLVLSRPDSLVIRPGLAVGSSADGRSGHLDWLRYRHSRGLPITIIEDEARSAVWSEHLARRIMELAMSGISGIRHVPATDVVSRPRLATHLMRMQRLTPTFDVRRRVDQPTPHLGRVEMRSIHRDPFATPLLSVIRTRFPSPVPRLLREAAA